MICPICNKEIADDSVFCTECGSKITAENNAAPIAPATPATPTTPAKMRGLSKKQFLKSEASQTIKKASKLCMILFGVLAVLILISSITFNNTSVFDLPLMKMAMSDFDREDIQEQSDDLFEIVEEAEEEFEDIKSDLSKSDQKKVEKMLKAIKKMAKKESVSNMIAFVNSAEKLVDLDEIDELGFDDIEDDIEEFEEISSVLGAVRTIAYILGIAVILLLFVSAYFMRTGFAVLGGIIYVPVCLIAINVALGLLILAAIIALTVFTRKVNKAWKRGI